MTVPNAVSAAKPSSGSPADAERGPLRTRGRLAFVAGLGAILAVGVLARLVSWNDVFTESGQRLIVDTDPLYHVLRAERLLKGDASAWRDANMNYPSGAEVLWPPGFDLLIAQAAHWSVGPDATREQVARIASIVPVVLGAGALVLIVMIGGAWFGPGTGLAAGALAAILPAHVEYGLLGRPDQHVAELFVFLLILFTFERSSRTGRHSLARGALFGFALALGPWVWQGAALYLALVALAATTTYLVRIDSNEGITCLRALLIGAIIGSVALVASLCLSRPSRLLDDSLRGLTGFQPASMMAVGVFAALVLARERAKPSRTRVERGATAVAAGAVPLAILALVFTGAVAHGLRSLTAGDPWLRNINEFQPALFGNGSSFTDDLMWFAWGGPVWLAPVAAVPAIRGLWRADGTRRTHVIWLVAGTALFTGLALYSKRFHLYLVPFLILCAGLTVNHLIRRVLADRVGRFRRAAVALATVLAFGAPAALFAVSSFASDVSDEVIAMLRWMKAQAPSGERRSVLAPWTMGHAIQYYADLPVLVTPFGTDLGDDGMRDLAAFYFAESLQDAEEIARRRQVRYVILGSLLSEYDRLIDFAPPSARPIAATRHDYWGRGRSLAAVPRAKLAIPVWLYETDGTPLRAGRTEGAGSFRLVYETSAQRPLKVFEAVDGARLRLDHAVPLAPVDVFVDVLTNQGRAFRWWTPGRTDASGTITLRVPYQDGVNGSVRASSCSVSVAGRVLPVSIPGIAVEKGETVVVDLAPETVRTDAARAAKGRLQRHPVPEAR